MQLTYPKQEVKLTINPRKYQEEKTVLLLWQKVFLHHVLIKSVTKKFHGFPR